jgi:hypothetical protein
MRSPVGAPCARLEGWTKVTVLASPCFETAAMRPPQHEARRKYPDFARESATSGFDACACEVYVMRA